jgi:ubiquinone/menaquinone biosynthesis C-methylase UbiE
MSVMDMSDPSGAVREAARVLSPGGRFCVAIVHPLNSAGMFESEEPDSPFVIRESYLAPRQYQDVMERDALRMTFTSVHRPLQAYVAMLADAGFLVERLREPGVPDHAILRGSARRWQRVPLFLHLRAIRS